MYINNPLNTQTSEKIIYNHLSSNLFSSMNYCSEKCFNINCFMHSVRNALWPEMVSKYLFIIKLTVRWNKHTFAFR